MPHTTHAYPFEARVVQFAAELSSRFSAESSLRSFLLTLDPLGNVVSLVFEGGVVGWHHQTRELESSGTAYLFYDPLDDGKEYIWLSWHKIEQPVMERLIGQRFVASDFQPCAVFGRRAERQLTADQLPSTWGVMFYRQSRMTTGAGPAHFTRVYLEGPTTNVSGSENGISTVIGSSSGA